MKTLYAYRFTNNHYGHTYIRGDWWIIADSLGAAQDIAAQESANIMRANNNMPAYETELTSTGESREVRPGAIIRA